MRESKGKSFEKNLAQLERDGFLLIKRCSRYGNRAEMEGQPVWTLRAGRI